MNTIVTICVAVGSAGCVFALLAIMHVRAMKNLEKNMEEKIESFREEVKIPMGDENRIGIGPQKKVMAQNSQSQESSQKSVSENSHFVSYFGVCFRSQPKSPLPELHKAEMIDPVKSKVVHGKKMVDEEHGHIVPCDSIEIPRQHGAVSNSLSDIYQDDTRTQTPPTDGESSSDPSSINASSMDSSSTLGTNKESNANMNQNEHDDYYISPGLSIETKSKLKDDKECASEEEETDLSSRSDKNENIDGSESTDDDSDSAYIKTPEEWYKDHNGRVNSMSPESIEVKQQERIKIHPVNGQSTSYDDDDKYSNGNYESKERVKSLEIPSYLSSDDDITSANSDHEDEDGDDEESFSFVPKRFLVQNIHSSLSIPDLEESGSDSDDLELSVSSGDASEKNVESSMSRPKVRADMTNNQDQRYGSPLSHSFQVQNINSSLSMPDLEDSGSESGDWELSSSSGENTEHKVESSRGRRQEMRDDINNKYDQNFGYSEKTLHVSNQTIHNKRVRFVIPEKIPPRHQQQQAMDEMSI